MLIFQHEVEFTRDGAVFDPNQVARIHDDLARATDILVLAHGWNNDKADARALYNALLANLKRVHDLGVVPDLAARTFGAVRVLWPSKKFTDKELIPGGGAAAAAPAASDDARPALREDLKRDPAHLGDDTPDLLRDAAMSRAQALAPRLADDESARREFVLQLRAILDPGDAQDDDGSREFFARDPLELFRDLADPVTAPGAPGGGADAVADAGGAAGLRDVFDGIGGAARRLANFATYYQMKGRAGAVGQRGVGEMLRGLRARKPDVRLHLIGHSFGGRLVTAAAHALPPDSPAVTVSLLQAAFSHNGLASKFDGDHDGAFRALVAERRASGPIVITHTKNDQAVGVAYPLASRIAFQKAAALGDADDPYGGMGRNGAQHTPEVDGAFAELLDVGHPYAFRPGAVYNLRADRFVADHSDITGPEVAHVILRAVAAV